MRLKSYLHQINALFPRLETAQRLLRFFALALVLGVLLAVYNVLSSTFNNTVSLRYGYMGSALTQAQTFFTSREALLESLSLSTVRKVAGAAPPTASEASKWHLGSPGKGQWDIWLTQRLQEHLQEQKLNLLYVGAGNQGKVLRLYSANLPTAEVPPAVLERLRNLKSHASANDDCFWLSDQSTQSPRLYLFSQVDERAPDSGWLGLEMRSEDVSQALDDPSVGSLMIVNADGTLILPTTQPSALGQSRLHLQNDSFFGFVGGSWFPQYLISHRHLSASNWQLLYAFALRDLLLELWPQLLGALLFSVSCLTSIYLLVRHLEQRFVVPALGRIQALIESEAFSRDVIQTAPVALCVLRRSDAKVLLQNTLAQQWLEQDQQHRMLHTINATTPSHVDDFKTAEGRHLYLSSVPTRYRGQDVLLCAFSDISARKQVEAVLEDARRLADSASEAKTLFLATMNHEIRTSLYGVLGTLELLARTPLDAQQTHYLQAIEGSSATLLQMISDVLDVSKIEAGQLVLEPEMFSPLDLAHETIQSYAATAQAKGLQLYTCLDWHLPEYLIGDITRIRQVLGNLLSNALKFTDSGRVVLHARVLDHQGQNCTVQWQVCDTGKGITELDQKLLFEPFFQIAGQTLGPQGTGLGLPICKRLAQLMSGTVSVVSEQGLGSSFSLTLPLLNADEAGQKNCLPPLLAETLYLVSPVHELARSMAGWLRRWGVRVNLSLPTNINPTGPGVLLELHPGSVQQRLVPNWQGPLVLASGDQHNASQLQGEGWQVDINNLRSIHQAVSRAQGLQQAIPFIPLQNSPLYTLHLHVLVAEDNSINQLILREQLEELGCSVELAANGEEALTLWRKGTFDVVLTDINMPRLNGYELTRELRRLGCSGPIFGATANAMRGEEDLCLAAGMDRCLVKPFSLTTLLDCLTPYDRVAPKRLATDSGPPEAASSPSP